MPRAEVDPSIQKAFLKRFPDIRFVDPIPDSTDWIDQGRLLQVKQVIVDGEPGIVRSYGRFMMTPENGGAFFTRAVAAFRDRARLPEIIQLPADPEKRMRKNKNEQTLITQGNDLLLSWSNEGTSVMVNIDRRQDEIRRVSIYIGGFFSKDSVSSGIIRSVPAHKANPYAYLRDHGVFPDREAGGIELRTRSGWTVRYQERIPVEDVLDKLFPDALREDHLKAPADFDRWAEPGVNLLTEFGISIIAPVIKAPVVVSPTESGIQLPQ